MKKYLFSIFAICLQYSLTAAQASYPESYPWKGIIQDEATSGVVTLSDLTLNGQGRFAKVKPGTRINGEVKCTFDQNLCSKFSFYRIVIGIHEKGPFTSIYNGYCVLTGKSTEKFSFTAPSEGGIYQIRFRVSESYSEQEALNDWKDIKGIEPDSSTTIGVLVVD